MAEISVIVPVYNVEKYLKKCLDSILNQSFKSLEIIAINDCSTDNSAKILDEYKTKGIKIINLEKNRGLSAVRNLGITIATGKYIGFVDSDDWIDKDFYEKLYAAAIKYDADIAIAGIKHCHKFHMKTNYLKLKKEFVTNDIQKKFEICNLPKKSYVWNKIYRLNILKEHNLYFEEGVAYEDIPYTPVALYYCEKLVSVPKTYYYYRLRKNSIVATKSEKYKSDGINALKKADIFCKAHNINANYTPPLIKKFKILGITLFKKIVESNYEKYYLCNIIRWKKFVKN